MAPARCSGGRRRGATRTRRHRTYAAGLLLVGLAIHGASCVGGSSNGDRFTLTALSPRPGTSELRLNDDLLLTFSHEVDPATVTRDSVRLVVDEPGGGRARGDWLVEGRTIRFRPRGVLTRRLDDGGYRPGARYRLDLAGFPSLGALRSIDGVGLEASLRETFEVVPTDATDGRPVLRDASPDSSTPLRIDPSLAGASQAYPLRHYELPRFVCDEPLDPRTLDPAEFEIVREPRWADEVVTDTISVKGLRLERNEDEDVQDPRHGASAVLVIEPSAPLPLADGSPVTAFVLRRRAEFDGRGASDFSGRPVFRGELRFFAARRDSLAPEREGTYEFDFDTDLEFTPVLDPASDGTAHWSGSGRVEIRFPAAAGTGADRRVDLRGTVAVQDLHATRLTIAAGATADLAPPALAADSPHPPEAGGLVVLRAQGRIDLAGTLRRRLPPDFVPPPMWTSEQLASQLASPSQETLSDWLEVARELDFPWTVVIAGGDLVVTGEIDVDTPLLLVAGGRIRGTGRPVTADDQLWLLGEGGGFVRPHELDPHRSVPSRPPLVIDVPIVNPLVETLTFVAISSKVPKGVSPRTWGTPTVVASDGASGTARVQYLAGDVLAGGEEGLGQAVRHAEPNGVVEPGGEGRHVRLRIELVARPGPTRWAPPYVDRVLLRWSPDPR